MRSPTFLVLLSLACVAPGPSPDARPLPGEVVPAERALRLLRPCSRPGPEPVHGTWQPDSPDIRRLEAGLAGYLRKATYARPGNGPTYPLAEYRGQFAGFLQDGAHWVYGAFARQPDAQTRASAEMCDGGGAYFGIEFNPATGEYRHLARNGEGVVNN